MSTVFETIPLMEIHELIGAGIRAARERKGWRQEDAAAQFRSYGLTTWRRSTVADVEAGRRRPSVGDLLLVALALDVTLSDLVQAADFDAEEVELGDGATVSTHVVLGLISGGLDDIRKLPHKHPAALMRFPRDKQISELIARANDEHERITHLLWPLVEWAVQHGIRLTSGEMDTAYRTPSDAERRAAHRLNVEPSQVRLASYLLWQTDFEQERDARIGGIDEMEPRSKQARRGLVTREMLAEMEQMLKDTSKLPTGGDPMHGKSFEWWLHGTEDSDT